jgi:hypothetical protein
MEMIAGISLCYFIFLYFIRFIRGFFRANFLTNNANIMIMSSRPKRTWIIILVILLMSILNPSYSDFKEYTGLTGKDTEHLHKRLNFFIFSIYENDVDAKNYLAILMNFIRINQGKENTNPTVKERVVSDSVRMSADTAIIH